MWIRQRIAIILSSKVRLPSLFKGIIKSCSINNGTSLHTHFPSLKPADPTSFFPKNIIGPTQNQLHIYNQCVREGKQAATKGGISLYSIQTPPEMKTSEAPEISSAPLTPSPRVAVTPPVSCPPSQLHSPSLTRSPLLYTDDEEGPQKKTPKTSRTPRLSLTPRFITPLGTPVRRVLRLTKLDPQDAWLPITESRNGNAYYAAFHTLCSGIGIQALVLPVAFTILGW